MRTRLTIVVALVIGAGACATETGDPDTGFDDQQLVVDFADQVVVPTYDMLAVRASELSDAVDALAADPTAERLEAAQRAWTAAREPWEQSEGFLFGPVDSFGFDPAMDSWPVNRTDLDAVLAADDAFTPEYVGNLQETQKGFHTVEYLLFGEGRSRAVSELGARELAYLTAIAAELEGIARALAQSWTEGVDGRNPYRDVFVTAGAPGNTAYPSPTAAAQEIVDGMIGICDEVANGKIADPYDEGDVRLVESQFAFNSIADFQDNLHSVRNAWTGSVPAAGTSGRGLSDYTAGIDPDLAARVEREIDAAIEAIGAIPPPFRDAIGDPAAHGAIEDAQAAVRTVQTTLEDDVQPLVVR